MPLSSIVALTLAGVCWGLSFPFGELAIHQTGAGPLMLLRFLGAAALALPISLRSRAARAAYRDPIVWLAGGIYGPAYVLQFEGLARTSVTLAALLVGAFPAMIALAAPLFKERVTPIGWAGVAAATLGAAVIGAGASAHGSAAGVAMVVVSMGAYVVWLFVLRRARPNPDRLAVPCAMIVVSALALAAMVLPTYGAPKLALTAPAWLGIAGLAALSTVVATTAWQIGAAKTSATAAGVFINLEPVVGAAVGILLFGERPTLAILAGGALIVAGSVAAVLGERRAA